jgi:hypothetical protein
MKLREAKERVERQQPNLRGAEKIAAIKALRDQDKSERKPLREDKPERKPVREDKPVRFWLSFFAALAAAAPFYLVGIHGIWLTAIAVVVGRLVWWWTGVSRLR